MSVANRIGLASVPVPSASFFSTTLVEEAKAVDFLKVYIPADPFASMANAVVPAIVVFSVLVGVALIRVKNKRTLLAPLSAIAEALMAVTGFVARLAPYGAFALTASATGTLDGTPSPPGLPGRVYDDGDHPEIPGDDQAPAGSPKLRRPRRGEGHSGLRLCPCPLRTSSIMSSRRCRCARGGVSVPNVCAGTWSGSRRTSVPSCTSSCG